MKGGTFTMSFVDPGLVVKENIYISLYAQFIPHPRILFIQAMQIEIDDMRPEYILSTHLS